MEPRFIDENTQTLIVRDISLDEKFICSNCEMLLITTEEHLLLKNKNGEELVFCYKCWDVRKEIVDWFDYRCVGIYGNTSVSSQCGIILHDLFNRFNYLHKIEHGYLLTHPVLKAQQLTLF